VSSPRSHRDHPAFPHANGFNGLLRDLPGDRAFCHHHRRDAKHRRQFDASVEASGPHDFAVRESLPQKPPGGPGTGPAEAFAKVDQRRSSRAAAASTASHPNVRDDRDTPLVAGRDGDRFRSDLGWRRREIFLRMGLDGKANQWIEACWQGENSGSSRYRLLKRTLDQFVTLVRKQFTSNSESPRFRFA
jgi:hypothetical protein